MDKVYGPFLWAAIRPPADYVLIPRSASLIEVVGSLPRQSAALFELPFELFSVALLIDDGTFLYETMEPLDYRDHPPSK